MIIYNYLNSKLKSAANRGQLKYKACDTSLKRVGWGRVRGNFRQIEIVSAFRYEFIDNAELSTAAALTQDEILTK